MHVDGEVKRFWPARRRAKRFIYPYSRSGEAIPWPQGGAFRDLRPDGESIRVLGSLDRTTYAEASGSCVRAAAVARDR